MYEKRRPKDLPKRIKTNNDNIYIAIPKPNPETKVFSIYSDTNGSNFGTSIIVITSAKIHFKKEIKLKTKPLAKHCREKYIIITEKIISKMFKFSLMIEKKLSIFKRLKCKYKSRQEC